MTNNFLQKFIRMEDVMKKKKEEFEITDNYHLVAGSRPIYDSSLNARDWLELVFDSLKSSESLLRRVAEKNKEAKRLADFLNCRVAKGDYSEKRVTSKEISKTLPNKFVVNDKWLLIPIEILEESEKKGQFLERRLFIVADTATLLIMDVKFRKIPQPDEPPDVSLPKINEVVSSVSVKESGQAEDKQSFLELVIPYFHKTNLGKNIIQYSLDDVINGIRELTKKAKEAREKAQMFIQIRDRLGIFNHLDP